MEQVFGRGEEYFKERGAYHTASEIAGQPELWRKTADLLESRSDAIRAFMDKSIGSEGTRIIFTGAGSSAFIGDSMSAVIARGYGLRSESIATTDIVSAPDAYLLDVPTLLVSYSRSGSSPESEAAIKYAEERITRLNHLILVCNGDSELVTYAAGLENVFVFTLPPESCDVGFAMTSSVSSMALTTYTLFDPDGIEHGLGFIRAMADYMNKKMSDIAQLACEMSDYDNGRLIYLGSGGLKGLAHEGSIKNLELTMGHVATGYESPMGFRHGPKATLDGKSLTVIFVSPSYPTRCYDFDVVQELVREKGSNRVAVLAAAGTEMSSITDDPDYVYLYDIECDGKGSDEMGSYVTCLVFVQIYAMEKSIALGLNTDSPCDDGSLNRVVQGVRIYPIEKAEQYE